MNSNTQPQKPSSRRTRRNAVGLMGTALLILLLLTACGRGDEKPGSQENTPSSSTGTQNIASIPDLPMGADWPSDLAPVELPEYTAGTVTAAAVDGEGVLTIKVKDTSQSDMEDYLEKLQSAGWIVTASDDETEAILGLYTVTFALQAGDTMLQIDVYTAEAGAWPVDKIPPDILEPSSGTLVGEIEVHETMENAWYFNYTYDGMDEAGAQEYMELLTENGWSGDGGQLYKSFEWNGKHYAADIEIYETVETRTTFTCNFYLSAATGKYEGGASGMGQVYTFKPDGTYTALVVYGDTIWLSSNYSVQDDVLALTGRIAEESKDGGKTWSTPESLPDASARFSLGADDTGTYLLLGEEGAAPPLVEKKTR